MSDNKKTLIVSVIVVIAFILSIVIVSYAFYTSQTKVGSNGVNTDNITATVETTLNEDNVINIENMIPGDSFIKTFSISSNVTLQFYIALSDITNTFTSFNDIKYVLKEGTTTIGSGTFPKTGIVNLSTNPVTITAGQTKNYTFEVTYTNTTVDQKDDMNKTISGKLYLRSNS